MMCQDVSGCVKMCREGQGSHEGLILYLKENVLPTKPSKAREGRQEGQGDHGGLIPYLKENVLASQARQGK